MTPDSIASRPPMRLLLALAGVAALMWPALVNRQPFFFPDTTAYVRAADAAVRLASGGRITTAWTRAARPAAAPAPLASPAAVAPPPLARASDGSGGKVMAGRSPYFGALLYLGYVTSGFWLFVLAQAIVAWWLIGCALRCFGLVGPEVRAVVTIGLALVTPVALYDSLLLADALAGFGILAFLILATAHDRLGRGERVGLAAAVLVSVTAHLTHIVMLLAMTALLALLALARRIEWPRARWPLVFGAIGVVVGLASVSLTSRVVTRAFGQPPALVPLITARFISDGPGRDFILSGCGGQDFAACRLPTNGINSSAFLWSRDTATGGGFLTADAATRARLSAEDTGFALAVLRAYPLRQGGMIAWNTALQLVTFDSGLLNERCLADATCSGDALPPRVRATLAASPSGQVRWPAAWVTLKDQVAVVAALVAIALLLPWLARSDRAAARQAAHWLALLAAAMLVNAVLGGAVSDPQGRYQARIVWLVPLIAAILIARFRSRPSPATVVDGAGRGQQ